MGRRYESGADVKRTIEKMKLVNIPKPEYLSDENRKSDALKSIWEKEIAAYVKRVSKRTDNMAKAYVLVYRQL